MIIKRSDYRFCSLYRCVSEVCILIGIAKLRDNNAKLSVANDTNQATINKLKGDSERLNALTNQLVLDLQKSEKYGDELRATLNKHDLTHLANKKPGLIEKRMQNATDKLWDDLESVTGDSGTE